MRRRIEPVIRPIERFIDFHFFRWPNYPLNKKLPNVKYLGHAILYFLRGEERYLILCMGDEINSSFARIFPWIFSWNLFHPAGRVVGWNKEVVLCLPLSSFCSFSRVLVFLTCLSPFLFDLLRSQRDSRFFCFPPPKSSIPQYIDPFSFLSLFYLPWSKKFPSSFPRILLRRDSEYLMSLLDIHR